jgi:hypothetical protein
MIVSPQKRKLCTKISFFYGALRARASLFVIADFDSRGEAAVQNFSSTFFKRWRGIGARSPKYGISLLQAFLFVPCAVKEKSG